MLIKTHLVIAIFGLLLFVDFVSDPYIFILVGLISTFIPDLDSFNSKTGKRFISRVFMAFTKHRGIMHSLFFMLLIYFVLNYFWPVVALGFLIGYSIHLFADCLTKTSVQLFWPLKVKVRGFILTGGRIESGLFVLFGILDLGLLAHFLFG